MSSILSYVLAPPNPVGLTHPFHMHGYDFYVVDQGTGKLPSHFHSTESISISEFLPLKDTVSVPSAGYAVVRILADNPGQYIYLFYVIMLNILVYLVDRSNQEKAQQNCVNSHVFSSCFSYSEYSSYKVRNLFV